MNITRTPKISQLFLLPLSIRESISSHGAFRELEGLISSLRFLGDHSLVPPGKYVTIGTYLEYPASRGEIHITSSDPYAAPDFDPGFLTHDADLAPNMWGYKLGRELARRMPSYRGEIPALHPKFSATSAARAREIDISDENAPSTPKEDLIYTEEDDKALEQWVRENIATTWHSIGTLAMKPREQGGVVDKNLSVYGVKNLKVIGMLSYDHLTRCVLNIFLTIWCDRLVYRSRKW